MTAEMAQIKNEIQLKKIINKFKINPLTESLKREQKS